MEDSELAELRKQCIKSLYLCTENVSTYLDREKEAEFDKLKSYVQEYCLLEANQQVAIQALERTKKEMEAANIDSLEQRFESHLRSMAEKQLNVANHPYMLRFKQIQQQVSQNLNDSDIVMTESTDNYIDPITKNRIEDPVINSICKHAYEKDSIMKLLRMKRNTKCPVAGCGNRTPITEDHLVIDEEFTMRLTLTQRISAMQEHSILDLDVTNQ